MQANVGIVLISHSVKVADGVGDIIEQMTENVLVACAGGTDDGTLGTSVEKITKAIEQVDRGKGVLLFYDIGSALMNAELALEMCDCKQIAIAKAPLVEGAFVAAVEAGMGRTFDKVKLAAEKN